jgi:hypothetical protein
MLVVTVFYKFFRNELVTQSPGAGLQNFTYDTWSAFTSFPGG